jgi:retron-type reverse transcriptase
VDELKSSGKSFDISKREVWEAYERVKAKKGAPGVDECSIGDFEKDLKNNLYRIWNRMSSGSYFPPPVRAVEVPKPHGGGTRVLGVPTGTANCAVALVSWSFGIVRHGHASVPPAGWAAVAGVVRAAAGRRAGIQL